MRRYLMTPTRMMGSLVADLVQWAKDVQRMLETAAAQCELEELDQMARRYASAPFDGALDALRALAVLASLSPSTFANTEVNLAPLRLQALANRGDGLALLQKVGQRFLNLVTDSTMELGDELVELLSVGYREAATLRLSDPAAAAAFDMLAAYHRRVVAAMPVILATKALAKHRATERPPPVNLSLFQQDGAEMSNDNLYRYQLWRDWEWDRIGGAVCWIMLNPSVADQALDDNTIRVCRGYGRRWGRRGFLVLNLYALRSTDPAALASASDPVGALNDARLAALPYQVAKAGGLVVCAWGAHRFAQPRASEVVQRLREQRVPLHVLHLTSEGHPHHPLRLPANLSPQPWNPPRGAG